MFDSTVLDVAAGLVFTFLAVSLAVSAIVEALASILGWRSRTLLRGVKDLLNDPQLNGLALKIYNHALVSPRDSGVARTGAALRSLPTYIDPNQFADALIDLADIGKGSPGEIKSAIDANIKDPQLNYLLKGMVNRATGDIRTLRGELAGWFDNAMDRVSGVYKRKTQLWTFLIALGLVAIFNVSAISVGNALWQRPMLARTMGPDPRLSPVEAFQRLQELDLPIGWTTTKLRNSLNWRGFELFLGWVITAVATLFGAPFWFDALERIVRLKGCGPSPAEKRSDAGAAA